MWPLFDMLDYEKEWVRLRQTRGLRGVHQSAQHLRAAAPSGDRPWTRGAAVSGRGWRELARFELAPHRRVVGTKTAASMYARIVA